MFYLKNKKDCKAGRRMYLVCLLFSPNSLNLKVKMMQNIVGIDIGGSHITMAQVDPEKREIISSTYVREHVNSLMIKKQFSLPGFQQLKKRPMIWLKEDLLIGIACLAFRL
jgi:hypothetical protein